MCLFVDTAHFQTLTVLFRKQNSISQFYSSSFSLQWYILLQQNRRNSFHPWLRVIPLATETPILHPSLLCFSSLGAFVPPTPCKWDSALCFAMSKRLRSLLRTAGLPLKCLYLEIRPAHGSSLGHWGGWVCWGFLNPFVLFGVEVPRGHALLDSLSACQHLVAENTKGTATQLQEKQN